MKIYTVRHGQTEWNKKGFYQGKTDIPLNEEGKKQATLVKEKLKDKKIDLIISSPLKRAKETAEIISDGKIKIITDSLIVERGLGEYEGSPVNDNGYSANFYWNYKLNSDEKGVESVRDLLDRAQLFLDKIKQEYDNKNILIVSHGATIRAINYVIVGYCEDEKFLDFDVRNCSLFEYDI